MDSNCCDCDDPKHQHKQSEMAPNGTYVDSKGGTENMADRIQSALVESGFEEEINIIHSRVRDIDPNKKNVYVVHDTWNDPESQHLNDPIKRSRFDGIVFVSNHQFHTFHSRLGVQYSESMVMKNAIDTVPWGDIGKEADTIRLIYHTTPHRGLELLVPAFEYLAERHENIHLDVYSSFKIYGWDHRDAPYRGIFERIENHPKMTYHGYQPNEVVKKALNSAHIFAYPNIWPETSCISAIEAMSAGCDIVCPDYEALPETTGGFATEYRYTEDKQDHLDRFVTVLDHSIKNIFTEETQRRLSTAKSVADVQFDWQLRKEQWKLYFSHIAQK